MSFVEKNNYNCDFEENCKLQTLLDKEKGKSMWFTGKSVMIIGSLTTQYTVYTTFAKN